MSDERRKRQEQREAENQQGSPSVRSLYVGIASPFRGSVHRGPLLQESQVRFFRTVSGVKAGENVRLVLVSALHRAKREFGEAFHYVPYVECAIRGSKELAPECKVAGVKLFPSWQFGSEPPKEGCCRWRALSDKTGCKLP